MKEKLLHFALRAAGVFVGFLAITLAFLSLHGCNVTRTITTESHCYQRGDTSVMIMTKTIETYDASKKGL